MHQTISSLADDFGVSPDTLRYYERLGLLCPADRTASGYRLYDDGARERLGFIRAAQRMGLRLADIKELLAIKDQGRCVCGHTDEVVTRRLAEVNDELGRLTVLRDQLAALKVRNDACLAGTGSEWTCAVQQPEGGETR
jgi:DNA-binding transcriptional MerR regulator